MTSAVIARAETGFMLIGDPQRTIIVEPLESPLSHGGDSVEPEPSATPEPEPVEVPVP